MKNRYVYIVFCNKKPIVYAVMSSYKSAKKYADYLIDYRKPIGFYHYVEDKTSANKNCSIVSARLFSACLKCDNKYDDGCFVYIERYVVKQWEQWEAS